MTTIDINNPAPARKPATKTTAHQVNWKPKVTQRLTPEQALERAKTRLTLPLAKLRALAKVSKPPKSWYEETKDPFAAE